MVGQSKVGAWVKSASALTVHYHEERNHQGKGNVLLFPQKAKSHITADIECRQRLGGLLRYYHRTAA